MYNFMNKFIWSDSICIEGNHAWFTGAEVNALFHLDLTTEKYSLVTTLPDSNVNEFRCYNCCIKRGDLIYCVPDHGNAIQIYDTVSNTFTAIEVRNDHGERLGAGSAFEITGQIFVVMKGLKQIIELAPGVNQIKRYHTISADMKEILGDESIQLGNSIYCISRTTNKVYEFDAVNTNIRVYEIPDAKEGFYTICHDGNNFILTGSTQNIYVWDQKKNKTLVISDLPAGFCMCGFSNSVYESKRVPFERSIFVNEQIWLIPGEANLMLYLDREYNVKPFNIHSEIENDLSLKRDWNRKYCLQYIHGRNIGIFSYKNEDCFEINTVKMELIHRDYQLDQNSIEQLMSHFMKIKDLVIYEGSKANLAQYLDMKYQYQDCGSSQNGSIGQRIYLALK